MKKCPFCAEEIQDEAIKCRYCGSTVGEAAPTLLKPLADAGSDMLARQANSAPSGATERTWQCPTCHSDQIQKLSVLQATGTSQLSATTGAVTLGTQLGSGGRSGGAVTGSRTKGTLTSSLATQVAPPPEPSKAAKCGRLGFLLGMLSGIAVALGALPRGPNSVGPALLILLFCAAVGGIAGAAYGAKRNESQQPAYKAALLEWERTYLCLRCGRRFQLGSK